MTGWDVSVFLRCSLFSPTCHDDDEDVRMGMAWSGVAKGAKWIGGARYRSWYLSHAKRALCHLSYTPCDCLMSVGSVPVGFRF